jgi:hypothetical protein
MSAAAASPVDLAIARTVSLTLSGAHADAARLVDETAATPRRQTARMGVPRECGLFSWRMRCGPHLD